MDLYRYRLRCSTEAAYVEVLTHGAEPTVCPTNAGHTVDAASLSCLGAEEVEIFTPSTPLEETLAEAKDRLVQQCKNWRGYKLNIGSPPAITMEYPAASGKIFSVGFEDQMNWANLKAAKDLLTYAYRVRTWDENDYHDIADAAEVETIFAAVAAAVLPEIESANVAIGNIVGAADIAAAEAAKTAYTG